MSILFLSNTDGQQANNFNNQVGNIKIEPYSQVAVVGYSGTLYSNDERYGGEANPIQGANNNFIVSYSGQLEGQQVFNPILVKVPNTTIDDPTDLADLLMKVLNDLQFTPGNPSSPNWVIAWNAVTRLYNIKFNERRLRFTDQSVPTTGDGGWISWDLPSREVITGVAPAGLLITPSEDNLNYIDTKPIWTGGSGVTANNFLATALTGGCLWTQRLGIGTAARELAFTGGIVPATWCRGITTRSSKGDADYDWATNGIYIMYGFRIDTTGKIWLLKSTIGTSGKKGTMTATDSGITLATGVSQENLYLIRQSKQGLNQTYGMEFCVDEGNTGNYISVDYTEATDLEGGFSWYKWGGLHMVSSYPMVGVLPVAHTNVYYDAVIVANTDDWDMDVGWLCDKTTQGQLDDRLISHNLARLGLNIDAFGATIGFNDWVNMAAGTSWATGIDSIVAIDLGAIRADPQLPSFLITTQSVNLMGVMGSANAQRQNILSVGSTLPLTSQTEDNAVYETYPVLNWIDLNNADTLIFNRFDIRLVDLENVLLQGFKDFSVWLKFRNSNSVGTNN